MSRRKRQTGEWGTTCQVVPEPYENWRARAKVVRGVSLNVPRRSKMLLWESGWSSLAPTLLSITPLWECTRSSERKIRKKKENENTSGSEPMTVG